MIEPRQPVDTIEEALHELQQGERAGVFRRTATPQAMAHFSRSVDVGSPFRPANSWPVRGVRLALAASLFLAVGVWTTMFGFQLSRLREQARIGGSEVVASSEKQSSEMGQFEKCLGGPSASNISVCSSFDYDRNGRVDLHDFSARQRATLLASN